MDKARVSRVIAKWVGVSKDVQADWVETARRLVPKGLYWHKTGLYRVTDYVTDSTNDRGYEVMVVYHSYDRGPKAGHVRTLTEFMDEVVGKDGVRRRRFLHLDNATLQRILQVLKQS